MPSAHGTVSEPAVIVIAGVIPVALLAKEHQAIYNREGEESSEVVAHEEGQRTPDEWQLSWQNEIRGRWTAQFLSWHGGFQSDQHKTGKTRFPGYVFCNEVGDDAQHTFFLVEGLMAFVSSSI